MWQLYQFPLCPFSRKVRLVLAEKGIDFELHHENPWDRRDEFVAMNPAAQTPVLHDPEQDITLSDSQAICEYFEETVRQAPMLYGNATERAEMRRAVAFIDRSLYSEVTGPLLLERIRKRARREPPDSQNIREAMRRAEIHLSIFDGIIKERAWLAGPRMSLADFAAAAQISVADSLGGIDWSRHSQAHRWYSALERRPSFQQLQTERNDGKI